jgi:hypothetical protein
LVGSKEWTRLGSPDYAAGIVKVRAMFEESMQDLNTEHSDIASVVGFWSTVFKQRYPGSSTSGGAPFQAGVMRLSRSQSHTFAPISRVASLIGSRKKKNSYSLLTQPLRFILDLLNKGPAVPLSPPFRATASAGTISAAAATVGLRRGTDSEKETLARELRAVEACRYLVEDFTARLSPIHSSGQVVARDASADRSFNPGRSGSGGSGSGGSVFEGDGGGSAGALGVVVDGASAVGNAVSTLRSAVRTAKWDHYLANEAVFLAHQQSDVLREVKQASLATLVHTVVLPQYRALASELFRAAVQSFEHRMLRVPPSVPDLEGTLNALREQALTGFDASATDLRNNMMDIMLLPADYEDTGSSGSSRGDVSVPTASSEGQQVGNGLGSATEDLPTELSPEVARASRPWLGLFGVAAERRRLQRELQRLTRHHLAALVLSGGHNPYLRRSAWPPIHLNLNYLVDPAALAVQRAYGPLYDEHREGACEHRADPLLLPGVAAFPFDPNQHPVSSEQRNDWKTVLKNFIS